MIITVLLITELLTASPEKISSLVALYKPALIHDMKSLIDPSKFRTIIRAEHIGNPERERIITGPCVLDGVCEYMSVIILQR